MRIHCYLLFILLIPLITSCGQPGPLYLPTGKPPIHVEPEPDTEKDNN